MTFTFDSWQAFAIVIVLVVIVFWLYAGWLRRRAFQKHAQQARRVRGK